MTLNSNEKGSVWLSPEVLQWQSYGQGGKQPDISIRARAYEIWKHAEDLLRHAASDLQLVDVITTMKRAIDHRIRALDKAYAFRTIPIKDKPAELLDLLEFLEIIRPLMFRKLVEIRNAVEHEDATPPHYDTCQLFLEFAWYFLRSTDRMLAVISDSIQLFVLDEDDEYWLDLEYGPDKTWNPQVRGYVRSDLISTQPTADWIVLKSTRIETRAQIIKRLKADGNSAWKSHEKSNLDDIFLQADVRGPQDVIVSLTKLYFSAV